MFYYLRKYDGLSSKYPRMYSLKIELETLICYCPKCKSWYSQDGRLSSPFDPRNSSLGSSIHHEEFKDMDKTFESNQIKSH